MARQNWRGVVIHHTAGPVTQTMNDIRRYHIDERHFDDVGYHFGVVLQDGVYEAVVGRPMNRVGAHCVKHNRLYLGVALVGDFTTAPPPAAQLRVAAELVAALLDQHDLPRNKVYAHGELRPTECPGKMFPWAKFRALVAGA